MSQRLLSALPELAPRIGRAERVLLCLGFDGTLAPIAERPEDAQLTCRMHDVLSALVHSDQVTVAVFSGRDRQDLIERIDVPGVIAVSNHGLEITGPGILFLEPTAPQFTEQLRQIAADFTTRLADIPGAVVENKGLTVSLHYRTVPVELHEQFRRVVHGALANASHPFLLREGRMVYEILPRVYWNKGHAVLWLCGQLREKEVLVIYIGDDATDEEAFTAIADAVTIKVGDPSGTAARYAVDGSKDVYEFLSWTLEQLVQPQHL